MHLAHLALTNFRTFRRLELDLPPGLHLITSGNALGKTNLLEAIAMLATARSVRGGTDADLIAWEALEEDPLPAARLSAQVETADGSTALEIAVIARDLQAERPPDAPPAPPDRKLTASRRFRVNGVARRASDLIGRLRVVMFAAEDLRLIDGPPALRRRYLDITISQFEPAYVRALQRYSRVLQQRNSLLRRLQESVRRNAGAADELDFWDGELAVAGAFVFAARRQSLAALDRGAAALYAELAPSGERLEVCYSPALPPELAASVGEAGFADRLRAAFEEQRDTDIRAGMTRLGPHRDDVTFMLAGREAAAFASRGEQRSAALALRLAEVALSTERTSDPPVLLLDDILSELDAERRKRVLAVAYGVDQCIITSPDDDRPGPAALPDARLHRIEDGQVIAVERSGLDR